MEGENPPPTGNERNERPADLDQRAETDIENLQSRTKKWPLPFFERMFRKKKSVHDPIEPRSLDKVKVQTSSIGLTPLGKDGTTENPRLVAKYLRGRTTQPKPLNMYQGLEKKLRFEITFKSFGIVAGFYSGTSLVERSNERATALNIIAKTSPGLKSCIIFSNAGFNKQCVITLKKSLENTLKDYRKHSILSVFSLEDNEEIAHLTLLPEGKYSVYIFMTSHNGAYLSFHKTDRDEPGIIPMDLFYYHHGLFLWFQLASEMQQFIDKLNELCHIDQELDDREVRTPPQSSNESGGTSINNDGSGQLRRGILRDPSLPETTPQEEKGKTLLKENRKKRIEPSVQRLVSELGLLAQISQAQLADDNQNRPSSSESRKSMVRTRQSSATDTENAGDIVHADGNGSEDQNDEQLV